MCGITGFWLKAGWGDHEAQAALRSMTDAIAHRGPDDSDQHWDASARVGLGHRRLSIVDLSPDGRQPMASASGRYIIVFNGEVYNFQAIRNELRAAGLAPAFRGHSDTEVMLAAVEAWGLEAAVGRFVGMFAFALWDARERRLSLVRDRLGVKPLYYAASSAGLIFGSELKALLAFPAFGRQIDETSLREFLRWGYVPSPRSIYQGVSKLEPGSILHVSAPDFVGASVRYWDGREVAARGRRGPLSAGDDAVLNELDVLLRSAVELRMIADVPLGAFLSGGIDSSLVVALMQAMSGRPVKTFSIGNQSAEYDESEAAARVAAHLGTAHTSFTITAEDALGLVPTLGALYDEPFADSSQIPTLLVSRLARQEVTVALTGDGGDEVFGGYNRHFWGPRVWHAMQLVPARLRGGLSRRLLAIPPHAYDAAVRRSLPRGLGPRLLGSKIHKLASSMGALSSGEFYRALCSQWQRPEELLSFPSVGDTAMPLVETGDFATDMMLLDLLTYLPDDVLTKVDRATMAVALEARAPLLDHRVVEFGWRLPQPLKIRNGVGKWVLRQLLYRYVPRELVDRPKMGFSVPIGQWLRGPLREWGDALLQPALVRRAGLLREAPLWNLWQEHQTGRQDHATRLWPVLMFQSWLNSSNGPAESSA